MQIQIFTLFSTHPGIKNAEEDKDCQPLQGIERAEDVCHYDTLSAEVENTSDPA